MFSLKTNKALAFMDDSGDPGLNGQSTFFVFAMLVFRDTLEAEKMAVSMKELKRMRKIPDHIEFKFNSTSVGVKKSFFDNLSRFEFEIYAIVVEKQLIRSDELKSKKDSFYKYFVKELLKKKSAKFEYLKVKIDGNGDKEFKKSFNSYLRRETREQCAHIEISFADSQSNILIQCADMIAGSIRLYYEKPEHKNAQLINGISSKKKDIWIFR